MVINFNEKKYTTNQCTFSWIYVLTQITNKYQEVSKIIPTDVSPFYFAWFDVACFFSVDNNKKDTEAKKNNVWNSVMLLLLPMAHKWSLLRFVLYNLWRLFFVHLRITIIIYSITLKYLCLVKHTFRIVLYVVHKYGES